NEQQIEIYSLLQKISMKSMLRFKQVNNNIIVKVAEEVAPEAAGYDIEVTVKGTVVDQNGDPIPGVTVSIPGTSIGTATDLDGGYTLSVPEGSTLVFSFIGYMTQRIGI